MTNLTTLTYCNMGFMGSWRETNSNLDGNYRIITDGNEFGIIECNDYGGFTFMGNTKSTELNEAGYRVFHDVIINDNYFKGLIYSENNSELNDIWSKVKRYKLHKHNISKNIQYGDKVIDLLNGETFIVNSGYDRMYINRSFNYKLVDRPELHPEPMTKSEFLNILKESEKNVFERYRWTESETPKKGNGWLDMFWLKINGVLYEFGADYSHSSQVKYYMFVNGKVYMTSSSISAPFYDTVDVLIGLVYTDYVDGSRINYVIHDVESSLNKWTKTTPEYHILKFNDDVSYRYNTRNTYL